MLTVVRVVMRWDKRAIAAPSGGVACEASPSFFPVGVITPRPIPSVAAIPAMPIKTHGSSKLIPSVVATMRMPVTRVAAARGLK